MTTLAPAPAGAASAHGARAATSRRASLTPIRTQCSARAILCGTPHTSRDQEDTVMAQEKKGVVTLKGTPLTLVGPEIKPGQRAPDFTAVDTSLQAVRLSDAKGKVLIVSSVPSLDTPVCDTETRRFNQEAGKLGAGVEVWTISMDLPFAQKRWCGAAGVSSVKTLSDFRERAFAQSYGVEIKDGPLAGLTARAVFVVGRDGTVKHVEYVKEIASEPNYDAALAAGRPPGWDPPPSTSPRPGFARRPLGEGMICIVGLPIRTVTFSVSPGPVTLAP